MHLSIVHRPLDACAPSETGIVWRTCLREVRFVDRTSAGRASAVDVVEGEDAYALLLEIVTGLRSPLAGETEVQAQFKAFLASLDPDAHGWVTAVGQRVLADAKRIRHEHLQGLGAHSYGPLAAAHVDARRVAVVGAGALAEEVVAALPSDVDLDIWSRRGDRPDWLAGRTARVLLIRDAAGHGAAREPVSIVIAAPIGALDLDRVIGAYPAVTAIVDLRAADQQTALPAGVRVVRLVDVLASARTGDSARAIDDARRAVRQAAHAFACREQVRPFGWDDLCA